MGLVLLAASAANAGSPVDAAAVTHLLPPGTRLVEAVPGKFSDVVGVYVDTHGFRSLFEVNQGVLVGEAMADPRHPDDILSEYIAVMGAFAAIHPAPAQAYDFGLGAGALARYFLSAFPVSHLVSAEIDANMLKLVRKHFAVDGPRHQIILTDGYQWLREAPGKLDVIWVDSFCPTAPDPWGDMKSTLRSAHDRLNPGGVLVYWLGLPEMAEVMNLVRASAEYFDRAAIVRVTPHGEIVLAVGAAGSLDCAKLKRVLDHDPHFARVRDKIGLSAPDFCRIPLLP